MTLTRAFVTVALSTVVCGAVGVLLGYAVGTYAPGYYYGLMSGRSPAPDPVEIGIGNGLNAGVFTGVTVGVLLVAIVTHYELRKAALEESRRLREGPPSPDEVAERHAARLNKGDIRRP